MVQVVDATQVMAQLSTPTLDVLGVVQDRSLVERLDLTLNSFLIPCQLVLQFCAFLNGAALFDALHNILTREVIDFWQFQQLCGSAHDRAWWSMLGVRPDESIVATRDKSVAKSANLIKCQTSNDGITNNARHEEAQEKLAVFLSCRGHHRLLELKSQLHVTTR